VNIPDAVIARIVAAIPGGVLASTDADEVFLANQVPVYDGIIQNTPPRRYVVVYVDIGTLRALAACGANDSATVRWQTTSVAADGGQVRWIAEKVRDSVDTKPLADGWSCGPIQHTYSQRPQRDETVAERPAVFQVDQYEVLATRV
jgi:hypothetical protein